MYLCELALIFEEPNPRAGSDAPSSPRRPPAIGDSAFWKFRDRGTEAGHFCIGSDDTLLRFQLSRSYQARAQDIFAWVLSTHQIQRAITSTIEPFFFCTCLDAQRSITVHSYLFRDYLVIEPPAGPTLRKSEPAEFDEIVRFYRDSTERSGEWIHEFVASRLARGELFRMDVGSEIVATGECIPSPKQRPYADLGVIVARPRRGKGLGTSVLIQLKQHAYKSGWRPICSCSVDNGASRRAIEKAGFVTEHRIVVAEFSFDEFSE